MTRSVFSAIVVSLVLFFSASAFATSGELLSFQGLGDMQPVSNFYNGSGLPATPNYGVTFSSNFFGLRSVYNGGIGDFSATPTGTPAIFINGPTGSPAIGTMNVAPGDRTWRHQDSRRFRQAARSDERRDQGTPRRPVRPDFPAAYSSCDRGIIGGSNSLLHYGRQL